MYEDGLVKVSHCDTELLNADMLTKVVDYAQMKRLMQRSDMVYIGGAIEGQVKKRKMNASKNDKKMK